MTPASKPRTPRPTPLPGLAELDEVTVRIGAPREGVPVVGIAVTADGDVPDAVGADRAALLAAGFTGKNATTLVVPRWDGPEVVLVGLGDAADITPATLRDAAAAFVRAAARHADLALSVSVEGAEALAAVIEGAVLARYGFEISRAEKKRVPLASLTVDVDAPADIDTDAAVVAALTTARAAVIARDLANTPPGYLTAADMGEIAVALGERFGFEVELFDKAALLELGCGGLLGVNQGSVEEPRMIVLRHRAAGESTGHLGLIGKGIMYDSGGISLKPSDPMHLLMKMDMGGAAAVLGTFAAMRDAGVTADVTGWLMCTDNMPSGTAYSLGDVLTARGGTTIEVKNTDAEGRLVMSDAFVLANEAGVDAIVDIATLTGAALVSLGPSIAAVLGNDDAMIERVRASARATDEPVWPLPLEKKYRPQLDSDIADISNLGGPYGGTITAALFLDHFAAGTPWAHLDIAGTMQVERDDVWRSKGATGFGARLLLDLARGYASS